MNTLATGHIYGPGSPFNSKKQKTSGLKQKGVVNFKLKKLENKTPEYKNGKICYIELPAIDIRASSDFYTKVFGWQIRHRANGQAAFTDSVNQVSGTWVIDRKPSTDAGILIYIMVDDVEAVLKKILSQGGKVVQKTGKDLPEITARFSDPAGNILGLYQQRNS